MPSGKTHDLVTIVIAAPVAAAAYYFTRDWTLTAVMTAAAIFGGLMFGPDLDTHSVQYTRWGPLRVMWWPYKVILPHRSRFSHGILLGTLVRVVYFLGVLTLILAIALYARDAYSNQGRASVAGMTEAFGRIWEILAPIKRSYLAAAFIGLWVGATSHTVCDVLGSFFKSVRRSI